MKRFSQSAFVVFFKQLPRLLAAGALFSAFFAAFTALSILAGWLSGFYNIIVCGLGLIPSALFLPGLIMVVRKYAVEKDFVPVVPTFFAAVRDNWKQFILHGFVIYLIVACSTFAIVYYGIGAQVSPVYSMILIIYVLFTLVLMIMMFYLPVMAVTYELRLRDLYKNSLLLVFGTILRNLCALAYALIIAGVALLAVVYTRGAGRVVALTLVTALCPLLLSYGTVAIIAKGLQANVGPFVGVTPVSHREEVTEEERAIADSMLSDGGYAFVNGKMIKRNHREDSQ